MPGNVSGNGEETGGDDMPGIMEPAPLGIPGIMVPAPLAPVPLVPSPDDPELPVAVDDGAGDKLLPALDVVGLPDIEVHAASDIAQAISRTRFDIKFS